jgi:hypothetical protein
MANDAVDFQSRRAAREAEHAEYDARHKRVVAIFKMLAPVVARAQELGAELSLARSDRLLRNWKLPSPDRRMRRADTLIAVVDEAKSKTGVGRPLNPHHAVPLVTLDGNIQNPITRRPGGKRAKVRHRLCGHRYTVFNLDRRFPWAAAWHLRTSSKVLGVYLIRRFPSTCQI